MDKNCNAEVKRLLHLINWPRRVLQSLRSTKSSWDFA